jgi:endonuclease I
MSAKELFAEELRNRLVKQSRNLSFDMRIDATGYIYCEMSINKDLSVVVDLHLSDEEVNNNSIHSELEDLFDQAINAVKNETNKLFWR